MFQATFKVLNVSCDELFIDGVKVVNCCDSDGLLLLDDEEGGLVRMRGGDLLTVDDEGVAKTVDADGVTRTFEFVVHRGITVADL